MNIKKDIKKGLNILLCFSIVIILIISYSHKAYADALSATVFLGESAATAATGGLVGTLLAPEVIIPMALTALGVAGLGYVVGKYDIINQVVADIRSANESFLKEVRGADGAVRTYVKGYYQNAKSYLDEALLKIIAKSGIEQGLFEGVSVNDNVFFPSVDNLVKGDIVTINSISNFHELYIATKKLNISSRQLNELEDLNSYLSREYDTTKIYGQLRLWNISTNRRQVDFTIIQGISLPLNLTVTDVIGEYGNTYRLFEEQFHGIRYDGNTVVTGDYNFGIGYVLNYYDSLIASGIGIINDGSIEGIPVTDNVPIEINLDIVLPEWAFPDFDNMFPVSLPWGYDIPVVYPPDIPAIPDTLPIPLPDFAFPEYPDNPADPDEDAQDEAQRGRADSVTEDGVADLPLVSDAELFERLKLPAVIRTKFPFCLFYDVYDIYYCLFYGSNPDSARMGFDIDRKDFAIIGDTSASVNNIDAASGRSLAREAPHYEWEVPNVSGFSNTENIVIDLSEYDDVAQIFRTVIFILFSISIAKGLVDAYKGTFGSVNISPWSW